jgi:hypothetical protein
MPLLDHIMSWLICLVPRFVCQWLWDRSEETGKPLGRWAPHVFGKAIGASSWHRVESLGPGKESIFEVVDKDNQE